MIDDHKLIELVRSCEHLYDKSRRDFKDKSKKENSWRKIATELHISAEDAISRWKSLREKYNRERKAPVSGNSRGNVWEMQKSLTWLEQYLRLPPTKGNPGVTNETLESLPESQSFDVSFPEFSAELAPDIQLTCVSPQLGRSTDLARRWTEPAKKRRKEDHVKKMIQDDEASLGEVAPTLKKLLQRQESNDDYEAIGQMIVLKFRRMRSRARRNNMRKAILSILVETDTDSD